MWYDFFSTTIFFRLLNFAAFIGLIVYLYKRYLLPSVTKEIQQEKLLLQNLENQKQGIKYQISNIEQALEQQQYSAQEMSKKVDLWRNFVAIQQEQTKQEYARLQQKIALDMHVKSNEVASRNAKKNIIPELLAKVEEDLREKFDHAQAGNRYNEAIVTFIKESAL